MAGVDSPVGPCPGIEPSWSNERLIPWEAFAYGEYIGPYRTPHVPEYRVRVNDQIEFVYRLTRDVSPEPYRIQVGDELAITSAGGDERVNDPQVRVLSDGTISLYLVGRIQAAGKSVEQLEAELNEAYGRTINNPSIVVRGIKTQTELLDLRDAIDARFGAGGQSRQTTVSPDGTVQLPMIGSIPAVGLTLHELDREVNLRYRQRIQGIELTPILLQRAPRFIYVLGEVNQPGRIEITGPTSAMQAIALAGGWRPGGNLRQIVVFRRDEDWRLMATKLDLQGALFGRSPLPSDEIWLRDSDVVLVPKMPIQRLSELIELYVTRGVYAIIPNQGFSLNFDGTRQLTSN
jgi:polysaccharide export outer membrane protein